MARLQELAQHFVAKSVMKLVPNVHQMLCVTSVKPFQLMTSYSTAHVQENLIADELSGFWSALIPCAVCGMRCWLYRCPTA